MALEDILRNKAIRLDKKQLLMTKFSGSDQSKDLTLPSNCGDFGRIHHFKEYSSPRWTRNPLPIDPVSAHFGTPKTPIMPVQLFQLSVCNLQCWYCFVDKKLRAGNQKYAGYVSPEQLLESSVTENRSKVIVLSGGQPDLVPEYSLWFLQAREKLGLNKSHYIWLDDNLSTDFMWKYLTEEQIAYMAKSEGFGRVGCLKGIDDESTTFNTKEPAGFLDQQIERLGRLQKAGFNQYGYITLTTPNIKDIGDKIAILFDKIQTHVGETFPLKIAPLEIFKYNANLTDFQNDATENQYRVLDVWNTELQKRFKHRELTPFMLIKRGLDGRQHI